jgi:hypothetical protein
LADSRRKEADCRDQPAIVLTQVGETGARRSTSLPDLIPQRHQNPESTNININHIH